MHLDHTWYPVKDYIQKHMKVEETKDDPIYFDEYDPEALTKIIETQTQITELMKKKGKSKMFQVLIVVDDFADDKSFSRNSRLLHSLYTRGRHSFISTITATQVFNALSPIIRKNATELYCYRLRNYRDLESLVEELSALCSKQDLMEMYKEATSEPYSFWYINLYAKNINDMFYIGFDHRFKLDTKKNMKNKSINQQSCPATGAMTTTNFFGGAVRKIARPTVRPLCTVHYTPMRAGSLA